MIEGGGSGGVLWAAVTAVAVGVATPAPAVVSGVGDGDHPNLSHNGNVNENCVSVFSELFFLYFMSITPR